MMSDYPMLKHVRANLIATFPASALGAFYSLCFLSMAVGVPLIELFQNRRLSFCEGVLSTSAL